MATGSARSWDVADERPTYFPGLKSRCADVATEISDIIVFQINDRFSFKTHLCDSNLFKHKIARNMV